jgi:hypothetical protein
VQEVLLKEVLPKQRAVWVIDKTALVAKLRFAALQN